MEGLDMESKKKSGRVKENKKIEGSDARTIPHCMRHSRHFPVAAAAIHLWRAGGPLHTVFTAITNPLENVNLFPKGRESKKKLPYSIVFS